MTRDMTRTPRGDGGDFWSRRKARVAEADRAEAAARVQLTEAEERARLDALPDDELLAELDLPDPDTLDRGDDFSAFMARAVPERLRRRALRRLWGSNPVLACVDGLNDYDDDYTVAAVSGSAMRTAYQVGRGIVQKALDADAPAEAPVPNAAPETVPAPAPDTVLATAADTAPEAANAALDSYESHMEVIRDSYAADPAEAAAPAPRRRMRFAFDTAPGDSHQDPSA